MTQKPRGYDESLLPPFTMFRLGLTGLYIGCACVGAFAHTYLREHDIGFLELLDWANCKQWVAQDAAAAPSAAAAAAAKTAAGAVAGAASAAAKTAGKAAVDALDACSLFGEHSDARAKASSMALSVRRCASGTAAAAACAQAWSAEARVLLQQLAVARGKAGCARRLRTNSCQSPGYSPIASPAS